VNSYGVFEKDEGDRSGPSRNVSSPSNFRVHERLSRPSLNDGDGDGFEEDDDDEFDEEELSRLERESTRQNVEYQKRTNVDAQDERVEYQREDRQERHDVDRRSSAHNEGQSNATLTPSSSPRSSDSASTLGVASREEYASSAATTLRSTSVADHRQRHDAKRSGNRWSKYLEEDEEGDQKENEDDVKRRRTSQNFFLASKNESSVNESEEIISNETKASYSRSRDGFGERNVVAAKHTEPEAQPKLFPDMTEDEWNEMFDEF